MFFFILQKTGCYFYYFGYFVILSHWLRVSGSTCPVNTSRQPVDTSGCLAASPRSLGILGCIRYMILWVKICRSAENFTCISHNIILAKYKKFQWGILTKCMNISTKTLEFRTLLLPCYRAFDAIRFGFGVSRSVF